MRRGLAYCASVSALVVLYVLSGRLGLGLAGVAGHATPLWPPAGLALAALVLGGPKFWPGVLLGAFLTNLLVGAPASSAIIVAFGNTAEAAVGAHLLRSSGFSPSFERVSDVAMLTLFAAAFSTLIAATIGASTMCMFGEADWADLPNAWWTWWLGDAIGILVVAPVILTWAVRPTLLPRPWWRLVEAVGVMIVLAVLALFTFGAFNPPASFRSFPVAYTAFLPLIWMALRFDSRGATTATLVVAAVAVYAVAKTVGVLSEASDAYMLTAGFAATAALTSLVISAGISERNAANALLAEQKTALEKASRAKDRFFAALSHELRTPLTPVISSLDLLAGDAALGAASREILDVARRNAELEAKLIDDLLDLNRIERGKMNLSSTTIDAHAVFAAVARSLEAGARLKHIVLSLDLQAQQHHVVADSARLQQVLWNLVQNAIKFTPEGGAIKVRSSNTDGRLLVQVSDTGIGVEPDVLPRLFTAFEQADESITRRFGGLGLGLSIAKALLDAQNGKLTAHSEGTGRGSTFTIELPTVAAPAEAKVEPVSPSTHSLPTVGVRILIVDDHPDTLRSVRMLLKRSGHDVLTATSVADATEIAARERFDLLVSDIGLPDGTGLDVVRAVHAHRSVPALALSGYGMEDDIRRSREAGFNMHLTKPVDAQTLEAAIAHLLTLRDVETESSPWVATGGRS